jgi:hypothetical protein
VAGLLGARRMAAARELLSPGSLVVAGGTSLVSSTFSSDTPLFVMR